jgi:hypothetical protein
MGFRWERKPTEVFPQGTDAYIAAIKDGIAAIAQRRAPEIESWMKANAEWVDRTSNARQTLNTEVLEFMDEVVIWLAHGMSYGWYLEGYNPAAAREMMNGGQYAIIGPAMDHWAPILWQDVERMLRG